ncbi:MAG: FtsX-like permease family protein [Planctomycetota bacterium]
MYRFIVSMRYLRSKKVNFFPISGVAVGVMMLTVIMSVMNGFTGQMADRIRGTLSDLIVSRTDGAFPMTDVLDRINKVPHVQVSSPRLEGLAFIRLRNIRKWGIFEGIDPELEKKVGKFEEYVGRINEGGKFESTNIPPDFRMGVDAKDRWPVIVSVQLLNLSGGPSERPEYVNVGEDVTVYTLVGIDEHSLKRFWVTGTFKSGMSEYDSQYFYIPLDLAQKLRKMPSDTVTSIFVKVDDPVHSDAARWAILMDLNKDIIDNALKHELNSTDDLKAIEKKLPPGVALADIEAARNDGDALKALSAKLPSDLLMGEILMELDKRDARAEMEAALDARDAQALMNSLSKVRSRFYTVETWREKRSIILGAVAVEKKLQAVIQFFIIIVAGFMVFAILHMVVVEKTKDIGILKALGGSSGGIMSIFLMNGLAMGVIGAVTGAVCGILFTMKLNWLEEVIYNATGWRVFPPDIYYLDKIPWEIRPLSVAACALAAVLVSFLASLYPAWRAARLDPIETLRYE